MKRIACLLLLLMMICPLAALAEDVCTVTNAGEVSQITTDKGYLSVGCPLDGESAVTLSICDEWGCILYQRAYGVCSGSFFSEDIYLPLQGTQTTYQVMLTSGETTHSFRVIRVMPRISDSTVSSAGLSLQTVSGVSSPRKVCLLDVDALNNQPPMVVPMVSGDVQLGTVTFSVRNGQLTVSAELTADGTIDRASVYVAKTSLSAQTLGTRRFDGKKVGLKKKVDVSDSRYVAVLVQLSVSYAQETATPTIPDEAFLREQQTLWDNMQQETVNEAVG